MIKILVPVSGGKDSQSCLKLALTEYKPDEIRGLFCDTKFEHPWTYSHIERMRDLYGVQIDTVCGGSVPEQVLKAKRFPHMGSRFCTSSLKIRETKIYCRELALSQGVGFHVWYGMRKRESANRRRLYQLHTNSDLYSPHDFITGYPQYLAKMGVMFRLPILEWSDKDVYKYLNGEENPLYKRFDRVGCFPCLAAGRKTIDTAFTFDDFGKAQRVIVLHLEKQINKSVYDGTPVNCEFCSI